MNRILLKIGLIFTALMGFGANINVPSLELITHSSYQDGTIVLRTEGELDMLIQGGYKFGGNIVLGFDNNNLESEILNSNHDGLYFKAANVKINNILGSPLNLSYFIGEQNPFCSGYSFAEIFNTAPIVTSYSGFLYFPSGVNYEGMYTPTGTGLQLLLSPIADIFSADIQAYQDSYINNGQGVYSADLRFLLNFNQIKLESFIGGSWPVSDYGYYRLGLMFFASVGPGEFLIQAGIPRWDPATTTLGIDLLFLLFEVKMNFAMVKIIPSVFLHPGFYQQQESGEAGVMDINLRVGVGDIEENLFEGGIEGNFSFKENITDGLEIKVSPYFSLVTPGVVWQLKINAKLFGVDSQGEQINMEVNPMGMFEAFIGAKAEF
ncbi:MAG: hypothetical protein JXR70_18375 [Spirochaetales bacterium]|nr:hypothetical protein [Spirochaetales bacterium]